MSLTVNLKNLGIIKQAEFSLGDLTIICGENNTGKTYITYALYGFLDYWHKHIDIPIDDDLINSLLSEGSLRIDLTHYVDKANQLLKEICEKYPGCLDKVFPAEDGTFLNTEIQIKPDTINLRELEYRGKIGSKQEPSIIFLKEEGSEALEFTLEGNSKKGTEIDTLYAKMGIGYTITRAIFSDSFPRPYISSDERTGVAIFEKELNTARNRLLKEIGGSYPQYDPRKLLMKFYKKYADPVEDSVDFKRKIGEIEKIKSFIAKEHPEVLDDFRDIVGGTYAITQDDLLYYMPKGTKLRLPLDMSSSSVRSLLDLNFYLYCDVRKGDMLMVNEPELNLHPENQRRIARLFARLVNLGVKVFITTHSDYIVKELNTLIMLNHDKPHLKRIAEENGYQENELIKADQVKVYVAEKALMPLEEGQKKRRRAHTLVAANIDPEFGIEVRSFDKTIDAMNRIQRDIVWGAKQDK